MGVPKLWEDKNIALRYRVHGQGLGAEYTPWLRVPDFPSYAPQTRVQSTLFDRAIHTFSYLERHMHLFIEFRGGIKDYREQFPLDRAITLAAAERLGVHHGVYKTSREPQVMTIDALVTTSNDWLEGWDAKPMRLLERRRIAERLTLHRAACESLGGTHHIFTEKSVPRRYIDNLIRIRGARLRQGESARSHTLFTVHRPVIESTICQKSNRSMESFCKAYDRSHSLLPGSAMRLVFDLIWVHALVVDLDVDCLYETTLRSIRRPTPPSKVSAVPDATTEHAVADLIYV